MPVKDLPSAPEGLLKHAEGRSSAVVDKVRTAIADIEKDIDQNEGIYPYNKGRLSKNEVCRRADINPMTLQAPAHKNTTNSMVDEFLDRVKSRMIVGRRSVRRAVTDRAEDWKQQHELIANAYHLAVLEHNKDKAALREANKKIRDLAMQVSELKLKVAKASGHNVITFPKDK